MSNNMRIAVQVSGSTPRMINVLCLLIVLIGTSPVEARLQSQIHFGNDVGLLKFSNNQLITPYLSPHASYIVAQVTSYDGVVDGVATTYFSFQEANQYFWDLREISLETSLVHLESNRNLRIDGSSTGPAFAFHPDEQFLAVATEKEIQHLSLPGLQVQSSIPAMDETVNERYGDLEISKRLQWSLDGKMLAVLLNHEILVWDIEANIVERYTLEFAYDTIMATETSWLIVSTIYPHSNSFVVCTKYLEMCRLYETPADTGSTISPNGQLILTRFGGTSQNPLLGIWSRQDDGTYEPNDPPPAPATFCPRFFSPDGRYIVSKCSGDWTFWDLESWEVVFSIPRSVDLAWLPDSEHLISWSGIWDTTSLKLYRFGEMRPIDELNLEAIPGLEGIQNWDFDVYFRIQDVSVDGRWVLVNLGWAALVVPIEFE